MEVTKDHVTKLHAYFLEDRTVSYGEAGSYADEQRRLQLRLLTLMLARLCGQPKLHELLTIRHKDIKTYNTDLRKSGPPPALGDEGEGDTKCCIILGYGPDENGKNILFPALMHLDPLEDCCSAIGDLLVYELCGGMEIEMTSWLTNGNLSDESPLLFHKPGLLHTPLDEQEVQLDLLSAMLEIGAPPSVESITTSMTELLIQDGCDRYEATGRTLAHPVPEHLSPREIRVYQAYDFHRTIMALIKSTFQAAGFKLQHFGEKWPLAKLDGINSRKMEKFMHKVVRHVNETTTGCNKCGKKQQDNGRCLLKCTRCRTTLYCSSTCQQEDWKTHKKQCKRILPSKR